MTNANAIVPTAKTASGVPWPQRPVLTLRVAGDLLGVSRSSLYRLRARGELTFARVGGKSVVITNSLIGYLETIQLSPDEISALGVRVAPTFQLRGH